MWECITFSIKVLRGNSVELVDLSSWCSLQNSFFLLGEFRKYAPAYVVFPRPQGNLTIRDKSMEVVHWSFAGSLSRGRLPLVLVILSSEAEVKDMRNPNHPSLLQSLNQSETVFVGICRSQLAVTFD